jgi:hypothetical protein
MLRNPAYEQPATTNVTSDISLGDQSILSATEPGQTLATRTQRLVAMPVILPVLLAFSAATVPLTTPNPTNELRRSGAASVWTLDRRLAKRISLRDARLLALQILAATDARLRDERTAQFKFFLSFEED